ncbi:LysR substrate-binding domain-containing protein [Shimia thalassica]|uniref:LysR substrate-binding domain-containing protein n=1 Tax=Shimia thalassica TaxID=1715693 RepID=UPI001C092CC3|nr:LysR substrate-binding domain-containing protein [Shimia thalassica]MBU2942548.1 LysR family transcriptional regulator [Shimia thalassica]MDO6504479.1 LysR substrate-binding domain-containing protein [Shimia thalassica]
MRTLRRILPSLNSLYVVDAVARHLNLTKAALELGISQPAVSKSIRATEENLGTQLFIRRHRGLSLTLEGRAFVDEVRNALDRVSDAATAIKSASDAEEIRVNVSSSFVSMWLVPNIASFKEQNPSVLFNITENHGDLDQDAFAACDFTTRIGMGAWKEAHCWNLARERLYALASPEYIQAHPECLKLDTLQQSHLLHATETHRSRMGWKEWFAATGTPYLRDQNDMVFSDHHSAIHAALVGQGVTLGWQHLVGGYLGEGRLQIVANTVVRTPQNVFLLSPKNRILRAHHTLFKDWMVARFKQLDAIPQDLDCFDSTTRLGS